MYVRQQRIKQQALLQAHAEGGETVEMVTNPLAGQARSKAVVHLEPNPIYTPGSDGGALAPAQIAVVHLEPNPIYTLGSDGAQTVVNSSYAVLSSPRAGSTATVKEGGGVVYMTDAGGGGGNNAYDAWGQQQPGTAGPVYAVPMERYASQASSAGYAGADLYSVPQGGYMDVVPTAAAVQEQQQQQQQQQQHQKTKIVQIYGDNNSDCSDDDDAGAGDNSAAGGAARNAVLKRHASLVFSVPGADGSTVVVQQRLATEDGGAEDSEYLTVLETADAAC